jgi:hypothetical protein
MKHAIQINICRHTLYVTAFETGDKMQGFSLALTKIQGYRFVLYKMDFEEVQGLECRI